MPTARVHTIFLHGGRGKTEKGNAAASIKHYRKILENRIKCIEAETAKGVYEWQVPGYSKDEHHPMWSGAFLACWQVKIGGKFESGWQSEPATQRYPWDHDQDGYNHKNEWIDRIDLGKADDAMESHEWRNASVETPIHIGNVAPYAKWLNYGGYEDTYGLDGTYLGKTSGYFFMEMCAEYIKLNADMFIRQGLEKANAKPAKGE